MVYKKRVLFSIQSPTSLFFILPVICDSPSLISILLILENSVTLLLFGFRDTIIRRRYYFSTCCYYSACYFLLQRKRKHETSMSSISLTCVLLNTTQTATAYFRAIIEKYTFPAPLGTARLLSKVYIR